jgi:hypothetical protein
MKHLGFTGTQHRITEYQRSWLWAVLKRHKEQGFTSFHHGECVGADSEAHFLALQLGYEVIGHPPLDYRKRARLAGFTDQMPPAPYMQRNVAIVRAVERMVAVPNSMAERQRSGTWSTVRAARRLEVPLDLILPFSEETMSEHQAT